MIKENFIILFGNKYIGQRTARLLRENDYHNYCFATSLPGDWDFGCMSLQAAMSEHPGAQIVVCGYNFSTALEYCQHFDKSAISFIQFYDRYPDVFLPWMNLVKTKAHVDFEEIRFADEESTRVFNEQIMFLSTHSVWYPPCPQSEEHFFYPMILTDHENFVDCGAFNGDTIRRFKEIAGKNYQSITAIEPNDYVFDDDVAVHNVVLGSEPGETLFSFNKSDYDKVGEGDIVKVETLDRLLDPEKEYLIKMDIEGSELDALRGAVNLLVSGKSKWSICLYHKWDDIYEIPKFIHAINPKYKLYLRRYAEWSSDLVLYVMP